MGLSFALKRSGGLFLHFALLIVLGWLTSVTPLIEWLVAFNLIGLGVALIVSGFYSQSKLLEKQNESDRSLASGYIILAGFLVHCAIKTVSKQQDSQKISEEGTSPPRLSYIRNRMIRMIGTSDRSGEAYTHAGYLGNGARFANK